MKYRNFDFKKDKEAVFRILNEVGWVSDKKKDRFLNDLLAKANTIVYEINGEAEVLVSSSNGRMQYLNEEIQIAAINAVTASLIARKQGISGKLTAERIALDALNGAELSTLSIFDQGYYNKLGYGNGSYEHTCGFSPGFLNIKKRAKIPVRLTSRDLDIIHKSRENRMKCHGAVTLEKYTTFSDMYKDDKTIGLGYLNEKGELTHHIWFQGKGREEGPIWIRWITYENLDQFIDLLALIKSFEEQYKSIRMVEPPFVHLQDFLKRPFLLKRISAKSKFVNEIKASAFWQHRILDLKKCLEKTKLNCPQFSFNLELTDPIQKYLPHSEWEGIGGNYLITLGKNSCARKGVNEKLPTLKTTVNAFTRLWMGILPASSLVISNHFEATAPLTKKLDTAFRLPTPHIDWDY